MTRPLKDIHVTCEWGVPGKWRAGKHTGIDYRAAVGTPVHATRFGRVVGVNSNGPAYGNHVVVSSWHGWRRIHHMYAHLSVVTVKLGQPVYAGTKLGLSGDTGNTTGPHLHYEERVYPFGYWNFIKPVLPDWQPRTRYARRIAEWRISTTK